MLCSMSLKCNSQSRFDTVGRLYTLNELQAKHALTYKQDAETFFFQLTLKDTLLARQGNYISKLEAAMLTEKKEIKRLRWRIAGKNIQLVLLAGGVIYLGGKQLKIW